MGFKGWLSGGSQGRDPIGRGVEGGDYNTEANKETQREGSNLSNQ